MTTDRPTVDALSTGFTDATRGALLAAGAFLLIGLVSAGALVRASRDPAEARTRA